MRGGFPGAPDLSGVVNRLDQFPVCGSCKDAGMICQAQTCVVQPRPSAVSGVRLSGDQPTHVTTSPSVAKFASSVGVGSIMDDAIMINRLMWQSDEPLVSKFSQSEERRVEDNF